jgi:hypothetical protein
MSSRQRIYFILQLRVFIMHPVECFKNVDFPQRVYDACYAFLWYVEFISLKYADPEYTHVNSGPLLIAAKAQDE